MGKLVISMRYLVYCLVAGLMTALLAAAITTKTKKIMDKLSGHIEIVFDGSIQRIDLPSGQMKEIFAKNLNYYVISFDISLDGKERVLATSGDIGNPTRFVTLSKGNQLKTLLSKIFISSPSISPDGKSLAYLFHKYEREPKNWIGDLFLYLIKTDGSSDKKISKLSYRQDKPSWFPDGKRLAVGSKDLSIYIVDIETGLEQKIIDFGTAPAVSHDGKRIAYLSKEIDDSVKKKMIDFQNLSRKEYHETFMKKEDKREELEFAKLFLHYSIFLYDLETKQSKKITDELAIEQSVIWSPNDKYLLYNDETWYGNDIFVLDIATGEKEKIDDLHGRIMGWRK